MKTIAVHSESPGGNENRYQKSVMEYAIDAVDLPLNGKEIKTSSETKEMKVFLVDDDMFYLKILEHSISSKFPSIDIKLFQTGEACLEQMSSNPDVVILDYYLNSNQPSAQDGLTILKKIKQLSPETKVIMLSVQDSLEIAVKCAESGSFDFIAKGGTAFAKINGELESIMEDIEMDTVGMKPYEIISIIVVIILIVAMLLR